MSLNADERETTITCTDGSDVVRVWTAQRRYITRLRANPKFTEVKTGHHGTTEWAEFTIPADEWNPASGAKRSSRPMTPEERDAAVERLARAREAKVE